MGTATDKLLPRSRAQDAATGTQATRLRSTVSPKAAADGCVLMRCGTCNGDLETRKWATMTRCPLCGSQQVFLYPTFANLAAASPAADKAAAHGDALAALITGWGERTGALGITRCIQVQHALRGKNKPVPRLPMLMAEHKLLGALEAAALARYTSRTGEPREDLAFLACAVQADLLTKPTVAKLMQARSAGRVTGRKTGPVLRTLLEKQLLDEQQIGRVLRDQRRAGQGILHALQRFTEDKPGADWKARLRSHPSLLIGAGAGLAASLLLYLVL